MEIQINNDKDKNNVKIIEIDTDKSNNIIKTDVKAPYHSVSIRKDEDNTIKVDKRLRRTSFQARLGKKMDNISRKLIDNQIRLTSNPTNMIRIKVTRDQRSQDLISRTISDAEIVPLILPQMTDIPMRKFIRKDGKEVLIPSLYPTAETTYYELYSPLEVKLDEDDLLLRIIEDPHSSEPYVLCLQIKEILGTLGYSSFRYQKFWATLYDEQLPDQIIELIKDARNQRELLGW